MNTNNGHANGHANAAPSGGGFASREKVTFELNAEQFLILEHNPPADPREGNWGPQYQYKLAGNRIAWLEPEVHEELLAQGARAGQEFAICKRKAGRHNVWSVQRVEEEPAPAPPARPPDPPPANTSEYTAADLARDKAAFALEAPFVATSTRPPDQQPGPDQDERPRISGNIMAAALRSAIDAAADAVGYAESRGLGALALRADDVRALAIAIYIQATSTNGGRRK